MKLTEKEIQTLRRHQKRKYYDRNGTGKPLKVIASVFVEKAWDGLPDLILLCELPLPPDSRGRFEYVIFNDGLYGKGHFPSDTFGCSTYKGALLRLRDAVFSSITGMHAWVVADNWKKTKKIMEEAIVNVKDSPIRPGLHSGGLSRSTRRRSKSDSKSARRSDRAVPIATTLAKGAKKANNKTKRMVQKSS